MPDTTPMTDRAERLGVAHAESLLQILAAHGRTLDDFTISLLTGRFQQCALAGAELGLTRAGELVKGE